MLGAFIHFARHNLEARQCFTYSANERGQFTGEQHVSSSHTCGLGEHDLCSDELQAVLLGEKCVAGFI